MKRPPITRSFLAGLAAALAVAPGAAAAWRQADEWPIVNGNGNEGITVGAGGDVFVTRQAEPPGEPLGEDPHVLRFAPDGRQVLRFGTAATLELPGAIAADAAGRLYVADGVNRLVQFTPDGGSVAAYDLTAPNGEALVVLGLDIDRATGDLYVSHAEGGIATPPGVVRFSAAGHALAAWPVEGRPEDIAFGNGSVYVVDNAAGRVQRFRPEGTRLGGWGKSGSDPGELVHPEAIAVGPGGDVFVAEVGNERVQRFSAGGRLKEVIARPRKSSAISYLPIGLDFDARGRMYVLNDSAGERDFVHVLSAGGCAAADRRVGRVRKALRRLRARDASARRIAAAKRKLRKAKQQRRAAC